MLHLRVYVNPTTAETVAQLLVAQPGIRHVTRTDSAGVGMESVVTADVETGRADAVLQTLVEAGVPADSAYFVRLDAIGANAPGSWLDARNDGIAWNEVLGIARANARLAAKYLTAMAAAGVIAATGVATANEILIIGAMAVSPDLLPLSALCVGLYGRRRLLIRRSFFTLLVGLFAAAVAAYAAGWLLRADGYLDHALGSGGLATLSKTDLTTVLVAFAAGVAGILLFETRAAGAVGVAISVTTIPAVAYFAISAVVGDSAGAFDALGVLGTNVLVLVFAGTLTLWIQNAFRARWPEAQPSVARVEGGGRGRVEGDAGDTGGAGAGEDVDDPGGSVGG